jgi:HAD superfamily hydrolase (TIGR01549 family)
MAGGRPVALLPGLRLDTSSIEAIVFDFYHTLVEVEGYVITMSQALNLLGYHCPELLQYAWQSDAFDGQTHPTGADYDDWRLRNLAAMCLDAGVSERVAPFLGEVLFDIDQLWSVRAAAGAVEVLPRLRERGLRIGVCSNWDYDLQPYLTAAGLPGFDAVVTSREVGARKPHPRPFQEVAHRLGISTSAIVFVGDSRNADIAGALRVGMSAMWLDGASETLLPGRLWRIRDLAEVERVLTCR